MNARATAIYAPSVRMPLIAPLFGAALFTSASLLFWVQPLIAKMLLPLLGGAPAVWNTCMLFFQALLLAGYAYVLIVSKYLRLRNQALVHIVLLLAGGVFLPFVVSSRMVSSLPTQNNPTTWLLGVLLVTVGPPFFVISATAPLLQRWFSHSDHSSSKDPYFLYAVSNTGSMLALLAFPFLLEPKLELQRQSITWAAGYLILIALIACCALFVRTRSTGLQDEARLEADQLTLRQRCLWVVLAFIPSSLMLGVTTYISTDVASVPLIWIIPLALYLLTFILAFANRQIVSLRLTSLVLPAVIVALGFVIALRPKVHAWWLILPHLVVFFLIGFICHRRLALSRPNVCRLPEYFLWIAAGGVLGGIFNALLAPILFRTTLEYSLIIILGCMMRPAKDGSSSRWMRIALPSLLFLLTVGLTHLVPRLNLPQTVQDGLVLGLPLALCYIALSRERVGFALALMAIMLGGRPYINGSENNLITQRNFFGVWRVSSENNGEFHRLWHGSTIHGGQYTEQSKKCEATSYYNKTGPLGQIFGVYNAKPSTPWVGATGLGAGTIATYSSPGQQWDFYEIDPAIVALASDTRYFTFLSDCAAAPYRILVGDARLRLREASDGQYGLLILDAFSSDSVPAHLLTRQALDLYLAKTAGNGLIAFHISNRYLNLAPLLSGLSRQTGLSARINQDDSTDSRINKYPSIWVVLARSDEALGEIAEDPRWKKLSGNVVWSDDFSNILSLLR